ncbi:MAG TPA: hypothetical protein VKV40_22615 [Ktedonobacteraceae bacterium]|nr:hypothetical protein [Ktedonobacteraceae bacterium]
MEKSRILKTSRTTLFLLSFCLPLLFASCAAQSSVGASSSPTTAASQTTSPTLCQNWRIVNGPTPGNYYNSLNGVAAVSTHAAWAVGSYTNSSGPQHTLIEYWNGSTWLVVKSPNPSSIETAQLSGVTAISSSNVWAVGMFKDQQNAAHALIEHWNGSAWSIITSPTPNGSDDQLYGVSVISSSDVWAVGYYSNSQLEQQTLIEHWNGSAWSIVSSPTPNGTTQDQLFSITAISASNIWAVGSSHGKQTSKTLIEHWNGTAWSIVSSPNTQFAGNGLNSVTAISASNIWAVGEAYTQYGYPSQTLIEHWNGSAWSIVSSPNAPGSQNNDLLGVTAISGNNIWAVGRWDAGSQNYRTLIEHWNGSAWGIVSSPNGVSNPSALQAVAWVPTLTSIWAVGFHFNSTLSEPLIERYC